MKVLIIEDDRFKCEQIRAYAAAKFTRVEFCVRRSFQSGLLAIEEFFPDLVFLDMVLPNYDQSDVETGFEVRLFGGVDILREIAREDRQCSVVVVTQFEDFGEGADKTDFVSLNAGLREEYAPVYMGAVYYHPTQSGWIAQLDEMLVEFDR